VSPSDTEAEEKPWSMPKSLLFLVLASVLAALMSEVVVGAAEGTGHALHMSPGFIGLIFVAIIGGAAESLSAINMAQKNKMDLTMSIALGSCIQISLFIAPLLVLLSFVIGPKPLLLSFDRSQLGAVFFAVLMGTLISGDGQSNWYKGVQLIFIYAIMAIMFYLIPS
jgi:Ca2+:H+ antiporter